MQGCLQFVVFPDLTFKFLGFVNWLRLIMQGRSKYVDVEKDAAIAAHSGELQVNNCSDCSWCLMVLILDL